MHPLRKLSSTYIEYLSDVNQLHSWNCVEFSNRGTSVSSLVPLLALCDIYPRQV
jgi:hypothetical protein